MKKWKTILKETNITKHLSYVYNTASDKITKLRLKIFDSDTETTIMDNSATSLFGKRNQLLFLPHINNLILINFME